MALKNPGPAKCHPEKRARNSAGECDACYRKRVRHGDRALQTAMETIAELETAGKSALELAAQARQTLQESVPLAALWLRRAADRASMRGDSRPAETILQQVAMPSPDGPDRPILELPARKYDHEHGKAGSTPIIVGVSIGSSARPGLQGGSSETVQITVDTRPEPEPVSLLPTMEPHGARNPQPRALRPAEYEDLPPDSAD